MKNPSDYKPRIPGRALTVIIRDDAPMVLCGDSPSYRSVDLLLTDDQVRLIELNCTGLSEGKPIYESVSKCFIQP